MHALTLFLLAAAALLYGLGVKALWRKAGVGRGIAPAQAACFAAGWATVAVALLSPLHHYAERLLWAHMVQHELLMVVAAPLIVLGRPLEAWAWAFPRAWRGGFAAKRFLDDGLLAWALHAAAIWIWHVPGLFERSVANEWVHLAQHSSFFLTGALFWWTVLAPGGNPAARLSSLFGTMLHTGALGALMAFSRASWYEGYALEDQQLAGLVMWIPAGVAYPAAALFVVWGLLAPRRYARREPGRGLRAKRWSG